MGAVLKKVRLFSATVIYRDRNGRTQEEEFPVRAYDNAMASDMAFAYVLQVLNLKDFELRLVGG